ncbi:MAG: glycerate kinase [Oscillospiraceae bacterium]|nr:glycerate kinase [Oscillospiraceae bacterium]
MKKAVIVPDSFKGTLTSEEVCEIIEAVIKSRFPQCETVKLPVSDGGEGFCRCMHEICGGSFLSLETQNPFSESITADIAILNGGTAAVEMASAAGITLAEGRLDPCVTSTYGVGLLMKQAAEAGCRKILLGLGGSCTNDGGCGAAAALGTVFLDSSGKSFIPTGGTLINIDRIIPSPLSFEVEALCDVKNPLYGENGAAYVFAPQKGADSKTVKLLDDGLRHLADKIKECLHKDVSLIEGGGAAGGFGAGVCAFFDGRLKRGIDAVLDEARFEDIISDADFIFTGEGCIDSQSKDGKVIDGVVSRACGKPVIAFSGGIKGCPKELYQRGLTAAFAINTLPLPLSESAPKSRENLTLTAENVMRIISFIK